LINFPALYDFVYHFGAVVMILLIKFLLFSLEYKKSLESEVKGDTSGCFERLLIALCKGTRDENPVVNPTAVAADVEALYRAGNVFRQNFTHLDNFQDFCFNCRLIHNELLNQKLCKNSDTILLFRRTPLQTKQLN